MSQLALSVWVRLLKAHGLILRDVRRSMPPELTLPQFDVLAQLYRRREGMTAGQLTRALLVTAGNVTGIVDRLRRAGLVERTPDPRDRRAVRITLTPAGRRTIRELIPRHRKDVGEILESVPEEELRALRDLLGRLGSRLEEARRW